VVEFARLHAARLARAAVHFCLMPRDAAAAAAMNLLVLRRACAEASSVSCLVHVCVFAYSEWSLELTTGSADCAANHEVQLHTPSG
jgi:hypothetical protein